MARDLLGQIADARASMMLRGLEPLTLFLGSDAYRELIERDEVEPGQRQTVLDMPIEVLTTAQGFMVSCLKTGF
jgi:hypothetical protein